MKKIYALQTALRNLGLKAELYVDLEQYCTDGKIHRGIELSTNFWGGDDCVSFVFHPDTHQLVGSYLNCPIVKEVGK